MTPKKPSGREICQDCGKPITTFHPACHPNPSPAQPEQEGRGPSEEEIERALAFAEAHRSIEETDDAVENVLAAALRRARQENEALRARISEFDKSINAEMRDPSGTIWEVANEYLKRAEAAESKLQAAEARIIELQSMDTKDAQENARLTAALEAAQKRECKHLTTYKPEPDYADLEAERDELAVNLHLTQDAIESFKKSNKDLTSALEAAQKRIRDLEAR